jgi:hypothetical protein
MKKPLSFSIIILFLFIPVLATDEVHEAAFYDSVEIRYRQEYRECTGDMAMVSRAALIDWKKKSNKLAQSQAYLDLLREYRRLVDSTGIVLPCKVIAWNEERKKVQLEKERTLVHDVLAQEEFNNAQKEMAGLHKTPYDFVPFPFGVSKKTFLLLFSHSFKPEPVDMGAHLYVNSFIWDERPFLTAFYFDKKSDRFFKYEIESVSLPASQLNRAVRTDAEFLAQALARRFGDCSRRESIGFFDIKRGVLSPYKTWDVPGFFIMVGISMQDYKYYAKAVVMRNELPAVNTPDSGKEGR